MANTSSPTGIDGFGENPRADLHPGRIDHRGRRDHRRSDRHIAAGAGGDQLPDRDVELRRLLRHPLHRRTPRFRTATATCGRSRVIAPRGTIVNPVLPAACAARGVIGYRVFDAIMGALAQIVPERVIAGMRGRPDAVFASAAATAAGRSC